MKRIVYVLAAALVVAAAGVVVYRTYRGGSVEPGVAGEPPVVVPAFAPIVRSSCRAMTLLLNLLMSRTISASVSDG